MHGLKSGGRGKRNPLLIILSPKALCRQCMKFHYNHITNNVGICVVYGCEFVVSEIEMGCARSFSLSLLVTGNIGGDDKDNRTHTS
jgi:hypothetical protein